MIELMTKKSETKKKPSDNRRFQVRKPLLDQLDALADRKVTDVTELVNQAVREFLEREGLWPVKDAERSEPKRG